MNGRRSFDPSNGKPFNINIYYNINSRNITNNHQVQSHPVTARPIHNLQAQHETSLMNTKNQLKIKGHLKPKKKKNSNDLGLPSNQKTQKIGKKSNNISVCSGFPSQTNYKKEEQKQQMGRKSLPHTIVAKNQKKLNQLLQNFSEGKLDKTKLTKQILCLFQQQKNQNQQQQREKKINKKKKSQSTLIGTATPKNQLSRLNSLGIPNIKVLTKNRKKNSKSQKGSYTTSTKQIIKKQIMQKIVEYKCINSSLFLPLEQDENQIIKIDRANDVQTSDSIIILNEHLKKERAIHKPEVKNKQTKYNMVIKIQRAWRKYKTKKLIKQLVLKSKQMMMKTDPNSIIQQVECVSENNQKQSDSKNLSQQLINKKIIQQSETARVEELKGHELKKWNEIMSYVKQSIENKEVSAGQCLTQIISYFQNAKKAVQSELKLQQKINKNKKQYTSRQITQFTNKEFSKQINNKQEDRDYQSQFVVNQQQDNSINVLQHQCGTNLQRQLNLSQKLKCQFQQQSNGLQENLSKLKFLPSDQLAKIVKKQENLSIELVEHALLKYSKKLDNQYQRNLDNLQIHSRNYLEEKKRIQVKYKESKKQIKRILNNLNKGYIQAKSILEKECMLPFGEQCLSASSSKGALQKCKSDNYLLKTAINYKKYIEKKETNFLKKSIQSDSDKVQKVIRKSKHQDNLQYHKSQQLVQIQQHEKTSKLKRKKLRVQADQQQGWQVVMKDKIINQFKQDMKEQNGQEIKEVNFTKLDDKIFSQELIQYDEHSKKSLESEDFQQHPQIEDNQNNTQVSLLQNNKINERNKKFKNLSKDEKQDIFQFLFIDLTLQLVTEYNYAPKIQKTIKKYVEKKKKLDAIPKGVKTNLQSVKDYLSNLNKMINSHFKTIFEVNIISPMPPSAKQMLKYMHQQYDNEEENIENDENSVSQILPIAVFQHVQSRLIPNYPRYYDDEFKEQSRIKFLKSIDHIHHKAIFDCVNEWLDSQRPYGIWGIPFPWKTTHKNNRDFNWQMQKKAQKLHTVTEKVIQCCSYMCGILVDKQQSVFNNYKVSEQYVEQIKQDRMSKMLANQLFENEDRWSFFDDQETQILIDMSKLILSNLLDEAINEITKKSKQMQKN